ncbi:MAG: M23 family metallopeptidase [Bacilli bacterium]|nr:MAG: M23 family metallopeptidase [Bacilli bacterium]
MVKDKIVKYLYSEDISFTKIKKIYNKYLGGILPIKKEINTEKVFNESLKYNNSSLYLDGVKLEVDDNYLVPSLSEGMVVFIGEKDGYGKTIIIEDLDGIYNWYGNIESSSLKLYDYVEKGSLVGEVNKYLYLVFSKGDKYLNYEKYIK